MWVDKNGNEFLYAQYINTENETKASQWEGVKKPLPKDGYPYTIKYTEETFFHYKFKKDLYSSLNLFHS